MTRLQLTTINRPSSHLGRSPLVTENIEIGGLCFIKSCWNKVYCFSMLALVTPFNQSMSLLTERNGWAKIWLCWKWVTSQFVVHEWPLTQVWPELRNLNVQNEWWRVLCLHVQCAVKRAKGSCLTFSVQEHGIYVLNQASYVLDFSYQRDWQF